MTQFRNISLVYDVTVLNREIQDLISGADSTPSYIFLLEQVTSFSLSLLIYKMKVIILPPPWVVIRIERYN